MSQSTAVVNNPNHFRKLMIQYITDVIHRISSDSLDKLPINIEKSVYNYTIHQSKQLGVIKKWKNVQFVSIYKNRLRSICFNMKQVYSGLISNLYTCADLSLMTHQQIHPEHWDVLIKKKIERDDSKYSSTSRGNTDDFTCRCGSKECFAYQLQTRSADEPMTTFVTCTKCGKRWKC